MSLDERPAVFVETMDDKLPETEWPCLVMVLEDSLVANERGRGMNSNVSEKPTRARLVSLSGEDGCEL